MSYDKRDRIEILKSMHRLVLAMNDEEAYMAWVYCIPDGADDAELEDIALHDEEIFRDACNLFNRLVKGYACKSGYCVSNRSGTNSKVYGVLGGERNADRTV
ncbi:MAG: hypothetical protein II879_08425 [Clostridia bacterium]|jgi:hypothetical protein|nr:hypothetical protein [Clostridia bacterium]MBR7188219.1 hypothetical protein [Clostridia bacterium]